MLESVSAFLISIGINPTHFSAGLAGSLIRGFLTKGKSKWETITGSMIGTFCAVYLTPLVVHWAELDVSNLSTTNAVAFGIGLIGMSLAEGFVRIAERWAEKPRLPDELSMGGFAKAVNPAEPDPVQLELPMIEEPAAKPKKPRRPRKPRQECP